MSGITPHQAIQLKLAELDTALKSAHPSMPSLLQTIHRDLQNDPDTVTLLTPGEMAIFVGGLAKQTEQTIQTSMLTGGKGKSMKNVGVDDV